MHQVINCKESDLGLAISKDCFSIGFLLAMCRPEKHYSLHLSYKIHKDTTSKNLYQTNVLSIEFFYIFFLLLSSISSCPKSDPSDNADHCVVCNMCA